MSLAIKWGDDDSDQAAFIYFDAVQSYQTEYKGKVTEHPIDGGATVADHFVKVNPRFMFSGVVTGADLAVGNQNIEDEEGNRPINTHAAPEAVSVDASSSKFNSLLPGSVTQFFSPQTPEIEFDVFGVAPDTVESVKDAMAQLISGEKFNEISGTFINNMQLVKLYEYQGTVIRNIIEDLVMIGLSFREDADSGDGLYASITFEQVRFAEGKTASLPDDVVDGLKSKAAALVNKGKQDSNPVEDNTGNLDTRSSLKQLVDKAAGVTP